MNYNGVISINIGHGKNPNMKQSEQQELKNRFNDIYRDLKHSKDTCYEFDKKIGEFVSKAGVYSGFVSYCDSEVMNATSKNEKYIAFYALCTYYRRNKMLKDYNRLLNNGEIFSDFSSFKLLELLYKMSRYKNEYMPELMKEAGNVCDIWKKEQPDENNQNVKHAYAEIVANNYEAKPNDDIWRSDQAFIIRAYDYVNEICDMYNVYPKYFCTKARILMAKNVLENPDEKDKNFRDALKCIDTALANEDQGQQFFVRIEEYERYGSMIKYKYSVYKDQEELAKEYEKQKQDMKNNTIRIIELLGLFTAVISLSIGSFQLSNGLPFIGAAGLIMILGCVMVIVYATICLLLNSEDAKSRKNHMIFTVFAIIFIILILMYVDDKNGLYMIAGE